ncbi:hypothetical protein [Spiroplasma phoeniceum]|uniref:Uncharacterized protein n=1 Tax=Spiroplasma phoeniceum P40 TaxID=1276259 RepID=A0A345DS19_9MOLU|nr:hypothetical protein [Spiroplasma phoeniceum]AXF95758.1 hypothetical protein SDAV_00773 [Spiroplasma phoeniceum P40]AXF97010.1 hypothetical protein SDAV_002077 [Spiroplasma phoeniceum P40]AXF97039.1 hypothetical protein SDAV_002106 [Spiroplasma phoeniceum P40]AXF97077.1 hypothetical protein SDAV_002144 [Spiroplasma phoeniceum P40]
MAKYCKKCQCPVNQINSDYCLFCDNDVLKEELTELKQQILYKEDFQKVTCLWEHSSICCDNGITFYLKDNSKYDKLPSKEDE